MRLLTNDWKKSFGSLLLWKLLMLMPMLRAVDVDADADAKRC